MPSMVPGLAGAVQVTFTLLFDTSGLATEVTVGADGTVPLKKIKYAHNKILLLLV